MMDPCILSLTCLVSLLVLQVLVVGSRHAGSVRRPPRTSHYLSILPVVVVVVLVVVVVVSILLVK